MKITPVVTLAAALTVAATLSFTMFSSAAPRARGPLPDAPGLTFGAERPPAVLTRPEHHASYLIITDAPLVGQFERFAQWKRRNGTRTEVRTLRTIRRQYRDAVDDAERVRLAIRDAYARGTRWVLLGGDTEVIPTRIVHSDFLASIQPNYGDFPSDHYFACLDGSWNADGDARFGEQYGDDVDLIPEVFVGRAPVRSAAEARRFVEKTIDYAEGRALPESRQTLFMAEVLDGVPVDFALFVDQMLGQAPWSSIDAVRLYENYADPQLAPGALPENKPSVIEHLERGYPLSVFEGAGSATEMSVGVIPADLLGIADVLALENRRHLTHLFQATAFTHDITTESIGESFLRARGGAVTSFGPSSCTFVGQITALRREYLRQWVDGVPTAGELSARSRLTSPHDIQLAYVLLGDPQARIVPDVRVARGRDVLPEDQAVTDVEAVPAIATSGSAIGNGVAWPNPARDRISIDVELAPRAAGPLNAAIFDLAGRRVRTLANAVPASGRLTANWDLRDGSGRRVDEGVYFLCVQQGDARRIWRLLVVR